MTTNSAAAEPAPPTTPSMLRRIVAASMSGTAIEWYDFAIYSTSATLVFGTQFFPQTGNPLDGILAAFLTYAVGFVARPIGGIVFGHFGDKHGRKAMLQLSIILIGTATFLMGLLPTYPMVGYLAPVCLAVLRFVQGFAVGGEWGGAVLLIAEHAKDNQRGFLSSFVQAAAPVGNVIASLTLLILSAAMPSDQFISWGWRIAFLMSAAIAFVGWYIRTRIEDAPIFKEQAEKAAQSQEKRPPALEVIRKYPKNLLLGIGTKLVENIWYWIVATFSVTYLNYLGVVPTSILSLVLAAQFCNIFVMILMGRLSDKVGRKPIYFTGIVLSAIWAFVMFPLYETRNLGLALFGIVVGLVTWSVTYAPQAAIMAEMFPTRVRNSGASISYQVSSIFAGSLAPIIGTWLLNTTHSSVPISIYVAIAAVISFVCLLFVKETKGVSLRDIDAESGGTDESNPPRAVDATTTD